MAGGCVIWHCLLATWRWLFVDECGHADSLLSLSFAVNFSNLSFSRFNICAWIRRKVAKWEKDTLDDKFLTNIERLGKGNGEVASRLAAHSRRVESFTTAMENGLYSWEHALRPLTICCAVTAIFLMAFEIRTRIGIALACPYLIFLFCHTLWAFARMARVYISQRDLLKAKSAAEKKEQDVVDMADYIRRLKANRDALSLQGKPRKARKPRKTSGA